MQEAMPEFWSSRLFAKLGADYGIVRNEGNPKMEYNPLLWRKSRLELIEGGTHVYVDNPEKSKGFGWGVFRDKATGRTLISYSTHLWWKWKKPEDSEMRVRNARELLAKMAELQAKYNCPVVGGGDLNCTRAQMEKGLLTPLPDWEKAGFADAQYTVPGASPYSSNHGDPRRDAVGNYRGWIRPEAGDPKNSLDHVHYTTNGVAPVALVVDRAQDALEVSDHSPVIFTFRLVN
jgi:endonuclease/exonuclease/phosphatase family metal-dependent hydrolase